MSPRSPAITDQRRRQSAQAQLEEVTARLEGTERRLLQVQNTLKAVAQNGGVAVGGPCSRCDRSYLLISEGTITCPQCSYQRSL